MVFNNFSDMEKVFLEYFFEKLDLFQIDYIVLRNYELLPETVEGSDIDILVRKKAFSKFINCFLSEVYNIGYTPWKAYRKNFGMLQYSFKPIAINNPQDIIRIDFIFDSFIQLINNRFHFLMIYKMTDVINDDSKFHLN